MRNRGVFLCVLVSTCCGAGIGLAPTNAAAQSGFVIETVVSAGDAGIQMSIAIDRFGYPRIGYVSSPPTIGLKYATLTPPVPVKNTTWGALKALLDKR